MNTTFNFTGEIFLPREDAKNPFVKETNYTDKRTGKEIKALSMNFGVRSDSANMQFVSLFASDNKDDFKTFDRDGNKVTVPYAERKDKDILKNLSSYGLYTAFLGDANELSVLKSAIENDDYADAETYGATDRESAQQLINSINEERISFLSPYEFVAYLREELPKYKGKVTVTGQMRKRYYNGKYTEEFSVKNVFAVSDVAKTKLKLRMDFFYNKDSVDKSDFEATKKVYVSGYLDQYINSTEKNKFIPQMLVLDASKVNFDNEKHQKRWDYIVKSVTTKEKTFVHMPFEISLINGADTVEFTEDMLTAAQKEMIDLGMRTLEDFKPRGLIYGNRVREFRIIAPDLTGDFKDGAIKCDFTEKEFNENIYNPNKTVDVEAEVKKTSSKPVVEEDDEDDEDLFG